MPAITVKVDFDYRQTSFVMDLEEARDAAILSFLRGGMLYEPDVAHAMMRTLRPGDVALDIGANIGFFSVLMGVLVGQDGHVVSFEPDADNIARLRRNAELSQLHNVSVVDRPASDTAGPVRFWLNSDGRGGNALWDPGAFPGNEKSRENPRPVACLATTVDTELDRLALPPPRLIKIDTEGAEHRILAGARGLLEGRKVPFVIAELHDFGLQQLGSSQQELRGFMQSFGYDTFGLYFDGALPKLIPPATRIEAPHIVNLLFSTVEQIAQVWPLERFDSTVMARLR